MSNIHFIIGLLCELSHGLSEHLVLRLLFEEYLLQSISLALQVGKDASTYDSEVSADDVDAFYQIVQHMLFEQLLKFPVGSFPLRFD